MSKLRKYAAIAIAIAVVTSLQTATSQAAPTTVSVIMPNQWKDVFDPEIKKFNAANSDVNINVLWGAAQDQLIAANKAPDIINTGDLFIATQRNMLLDLNPYLKSDGTVNVKDFYPALYKSLQFQGKQLALPYRFNVGLLYYNKDLFDAAKVAYPTATWKQFDYISAAQKLTKTTNGKVTQWGVSSTFGWWGEWLINVRQAGGNWLEDAVVALNSPNAIKGLTFFRDKITKYKIAPGPKDDSLGGFAGGKVAMEYGGHTGNWPSYNAAKGLNWDVQVLPQGSKTAKGGELALEAWGVNAKTANKDAAYKVAKYLTSTDFLTIQWTKLGLPPTRQSVAKIAMAVPAAKRTSPTNIESLFRGIKTGMTLPRTIPFIKVTQEVVQPFIDKMIEGTLTPTEAGQQATDAANKALSILSN